MTLLTFKFQIGDKAWTIYSPIPKEVIKLHFNGVSTFYTLDDKSEVEEKNLLTGSEYNNYRTNYLTQIIVDSQEKLELLNIEKENL